MTNSSKSEKKKEAKVARARHLIVGAVLVIAAAIASYGLLYSSGVTQGEFVAGTHYKVLDIGNRQRPGAPIEVREFFSYGCVHCKNFDPLIEQWLETAPADISFSRVPVAFSPQWVLLAQTYLTLKELDILSENHDRLFRQIHDNRQTFQSGEEIADFIDGHGTTSSEFLRVFNSTAVRRQLGEIDSAQRVVGISSVPTMVVAGKYVVSMDLGRKTALEIVDFLIAKEQATALGGDTGAAADDADAAADDGGAAADSAGS
jgi:thiol:disulfide interchange protein DsbA